MRRIRQQYWFCLAGICLVGSLMMIWSSDIPIAETSVEKHSLPKNLAPVRQLADLAAATAFYDANQSPLIGGSDRHQEIDQAEFILAPTGVPGRMASPLNTTGRVIPRDRLVPAHFQQMNSATSSSPVWLSGQIEAIEEEA